MIKIKKSVVVFDFDGTLVKSFPLIVKCFLDTLPKFNCEKVKTEADLEKYYGPDEFGMFQKILGDSGKATKAFSMYLEEYASLHHDLLAKPFPGILDLLKELRTRRTLRLALVTGRSKESLQISLEALNLERFFEDIQWGSPKGVVKADNMKKVFKNLGVDRNECLYIGDSISDVKSMQSIGVSILSVYYNDPKLKDQLEKLNPGMCAGSVEELRDLLLKNIR